MPNPHLPEPSPPGPPSLMTDEELQKILQLGYERFRVLVIGDAGVGKKTIIQKVHEAAIFRPDGMGNKISTTDVVPIDISGTHDIETEIIYPPDVGFVFHVSRGGLDNLTKVRKFIAERADRKDLKERLHAIWYCISAADDPLSPVVRMFFDEKVADVPVFLVITKGDTLRCAICSEANEAVSPFDTQTTARSEACPHMEDKLKSTCSHFNNTPCRAANVICIRDMHEPQTKCDRLVKQCGPHFTWDVQKLLFTSVLRNNADLLIEHAIQRAIIPWVQKSIETGSFTEKGWKSLVYEIMTSFQYKLLMLLYELDYFPQEQIYELLFPFLPSLVGQPSCLRQVLRLGTVITAFSHAFLFLPITPSFMEGIEMAVNICCRSLYASKLIVAVEKTFRGSYTVTEVDVSKVSAIVLVNKIYAHPSTL